MPAIHPQNARTRVSMCLSHWQRFQDMRILMDPLLEIKMSMLLGAQSPPSMGISRASYLSMRSLTTEFKSKILLQTRMDRNLWASRFSRKHPSPVWTFLPMEAPNTPMCTKEAEESSLRSAAIACIEQRPRHPLNCTLVL